MPIAAIAPQFFSTDVARTLAYYRDALGFETQFEYGDPVSYAGAIRDDLSIFFRVIDTPLPQVPGKLDLELLDVYVRVVDVEGLFAEYQSRNVTMHRPLARQPWGFAEFVVHDCDGRLLCFGEMKEMV